MEHTDGPADRRQTLVLVLGMHRSGTSAVAGVLDGLGIRAGDDVLPPRGDNPLGFFEDAEIVAIHERLLAAFGLDWASTDALPRDWLASEAARSAEQAIDRALERLFAAGPLALVKDPRACRFVPLWRRITTRRGIDARFVLVVRHPDEVAQSLATRGGSTLPAGRALWLRHMLDAEAATRECPRVVVSYAALMRDPAAEVVRMLAGLRLEGSLVAPQAAAFDGLLRQELRHHVHEVAADEDGIASRVHRAFAALSTGDSGAPSTLEALDGLRIEAEAWLAAFATALGERVQSLVRQRLDALDAHVALEAKRVALAAEAARVAGWWSAAPAEEVPLPRLYVALGEAAFDESSAFDAVIESQGGTHSARFGPICAAGPVRLRFDPDSSSGVFAVLRILVDGLALRPPESVPAACSDALLASRDAALACFACTHRDPWVEFRLPAGLGTDGEATVTVEFRRETVQGLVSVQLQAGLAPLIQAQAGIATALAALDARLDADARIASAVVALDARLATGEAQVAALRESTSALSEQGAGVQRTVDTMLRWMERRSPGYWLRRWGFGRRTDTGSTS